MGLIGAQCVGRVVDDLGMAEKTFRPWDLDQIWLLPPSVRDFVPEGHVAHVVRDVVRNELDLSAVFARYTELRGHPPYHPTMMVEAWLEKVAAEWRMLCTAHNLLKLAAARA